MNKGLTVVVGSLGVGFIDTPLLNSHLISDTIGDPIDLFKPIETAGAEIAQVVMVIGVIVGILMMLFNKK